MRRVTDSRAVGTKMCLFVLWPANYKQGRAVSGELQGPLAWNRGKGT